MHLVFISHVDEENSSKSISSNYLALFSTREEPYRNMRSNSSSSHSSFVLNVTVTLHPLKKLISLPLFNIYFPLSLSLSPYFPFDFGLINNE